MIDLPLKPPTERDVVGDIPATLAWVAAWRAAQDTLPITVTWVQRRWPSVGTQDVPERAAAIGAEAIAVVSGSPVEYKRMRERCGALRAVVAATAPDSAETIGVLRRHAGAIAGLTEQDFGILTGVVTWLVANPVSGRRVRELPIRGIDTKWLEGHRSVVETLVSAATGREGLGLMSAPRRVRLRALDARATIGGLTDVTASVAELAALDPGVGTVIITENLETLLALPPRPGLVAIHGGGYAVDRIAEIPWLARCRLLYWGDLDSHGFAILNRARAAGLDVESILMDTATLLAYRDLWVPEPTPFIGGLSRLTAGEAEAFARLSEHGHPRLEQERIPWAHALAQLDWALERASSTERGRCT